MLASLEKSKKIGKPSKYEVIHPTYTINNVERKSIVAQASFQLEGSSQLIDCRASSNAYNKAPFGVPMIRNFNLKIPKDGKPILED